MIACSSIHIFNIKAFKFEFEILFCRYKLIQLRYLLHILLGCCIIQTIACSKSSPENDLPTVLEKKDTLSFPLSIGTWWKYKRFDTAIYSYGGFHSDTSTELITVIKKVKLPNNGNEVEAAFLEIRNLTKSTIDSNFAYYFNSKFYIIGKDTLDKHAYVFLPQIDGNSKQIFSDGSEDITVTKNASVTINNQNFNDCIYTTEYIRHQNAAAPFGWIFESSTYFKPKVGFVYWKAKSEIISHYVSADFFYVRRILDYHIEP